MTWDATSATLAHTLARIDQLMALIDRTAIAGVSAANSDQSGDSMLKTYKSLSGFYTDLVNVVQSAPAGLPAYVQEQKGSSVDVVAEYQTVKAALEDYFTTFEALLPAVDGYAQVLTVSGRQVTWRTFAAAAQTTVKNKLQAVAASITS